MFENANWGDGLEDWTMCPKECEKIAKWVADELAGFCYENDERWITIPTFGVHWVKHRNKKGNIPKKTTGRSVSIEFIRPTNVQVHAGHRSETSSNLYITIDLTNPTSLPKLIKKIKKWKACKL